MPRSSVATAPLATQLRSLALGYPEVEEGTSCNKSAYKCHGKSFLFVGVEDGACDVMLKLRDSLAEAGRLAAAEPERYKVGGTGWVNAMFGDDQRPPPGLIARWVDESFRLLAPKQVVSLLADGGHVVVAPKKEPQTRARKRPRKKKPSAR